MKITNLLNNPATRRTNFFLLDGGEHAQTMQHFSKAIFRNDNINLQFAELKINENRWGVKFIDNLEQVLKNISHQAKSGDFVSLPALALTSLRQLEQVINNVLGHKLTLTTENLKTNKNVLIETFQKIYNDQAKHEKDIEFLDSNEQHFGFLYGVIREINKLTSKGIKFYIPSGHPVDYTIKSLVDKSVGREELYKYIATGEDNSGRIKKIIEDVKKSGNYNLNLLTLADANIVNVGNIENKEYIYSAFDSLVNDSERGVYNFCPIRDKSGNVKGFSFRDRKTIEYPINEYGGEREISELLKFVGLNIRDVIADTKFHNLLKQLIRDGKNTKLAPDKLYRIHDVYDEAEIKLRKLDCLGSLINRDGSFVFDANSNGEILFQKCNIEGSSRPSVVSMWGSCFSSIAAAKRDFSK